MKNRIEQDTMGKIDVPAHAYWGAQTQRALENFKIGSESMPREVIHGLAMVKKAAAMVNADMGYLPREKAQLICRVCDEILDHRLDDQFPLGVWQTGSGTQTNMNMNEVISNRAHVLSGKRLGTGTAAVHPNDHVNMSQSSNDTFPSAMHIAAVRVLTETTLPGLVSMEQILSQKADHWGGIIKTGRTHAMDAVPLTLGQEFSGYAALVRAGIDRIRTAIDRVYELAMGGTAVGTGLNAPKGFDQAVAQTLADLTGMPFRTAANKFEALSAHEALVSAHGALKSTAVSLTKIANDIRLLGSGPRCGIGELILPANEPGSSIMPGKVNPTQVEALTMVCTQVMGNDAGIGFAASCGQFELNVYKPMIIANVIQSARLLGDAADSFARNCLAGLTPDLDKIRYYLDNTLMLVTALNSHIGYEQAARIARHAHKQNISLKQAAAELGILTEQVFEERVNPEQMTGPMSSSKPGHKSFNKV